MCPPPGKTIEPRHLFLYYEAEVRHHGWYWNALQTLNEEKDFIRICGYNDTHGIGYEQRVER